MYFFWGGVFKDDLISQKVTVNLNNRSEETFVSVAITCKIFPCGVFLIV